MPLSLYDIEQLFLERGQRVYEGDTVSSLKHALQAATLAETADAPSSLITACLLHDLGHLIANDDDSLTRHDLNSKHHYFVLPFLRGLFNSNVLNPIRLHVEAKRYLCFVEPNYAAMLSPQAQHRLRLQGGSFDADQAMEFAAQPGAPDAIRLRRWDDQAKSPTEQTRPLSHFLEIADSICTRPLLMAMR